MTTSNKPSLFLTLVSILWISSCSSIVTSTNTLMPTVSVVPTLTSAITEVPIPTNNLDLTNLATNCVEILDAPPTDVKLRNSLLLSGTSIDGYILNLETNEKTHIEGTLLSELKVSPDMQKLAYINYDTEKLVISDANDKKLQSFDEFNGRFSLIEWLDNKNLAINKANEEKPPFYDYSLVVLNTFTGIKNEFHIRDFPNGNGNHKLVSWSYFGNIVPNPQLTKMIYPIGWDGYPVVIWDIKSQSEIKRVYFSDSAPRWSSDGTKLLLIAPIQFNGYVNFTDNLPYQGGNEIFVIDDKGEIKRLTYLTTKYKESVYTALSWSPTEEYIAFDLQNRNQPDFGLSILNVKTGEINNYCIHGNWSSIYWSPDGKQIAFTIGNGFEPLEAKAYIFDLEKNIAFKIADNAEVAGWVIN
jgi:WD40-like Beta Propeller Repeat